MLNERAKDLAFRYSHGLLSAPTDESAIKWAKAMLVLCWKVLPVSERNAFLQRVEVTDEHEFAEFQERWPDLQDPTLEAAARAWGQIVPTLEGDTLDFAKTIAKLIRMRRKPSEKQRNWMKQIYREWVETLGGEE